MKANLSNIEQDMLEDKKFVGMDEQCATKKDELEERRKLKKNCWLWQAQ